MTTTSPTAVLSDLASGWAGTVQTSMRDALQWWEAGGWQPHPEGCECQQHRQRHHDHDHEHRHGEGCGRQPGRHHEGCGCGDACACCVPAADVVLHARAGERRVLAFTVRNPRRRERDVTLEVGPWHLCTDEVVQVDARFDVDGGLTLAGCESRVVRLVVTVLAGQDDKEQGRLGDVASCASAYADVRFEGCARPQRVAVVVHPAACDAVDVTCDCGCC